MLHAVLSNATHPEYGAVTLPFPIPREDFGHCIELLETLEIGKVSTQDCHVDEINSKWPMFSIPRGYVDGFVQWIKQVIGLCLTAFLQAIILVAGLMVFREHALLGLGLMLSAGEVPRIAGTFGLDTTTHANIMSAVYTAQAAVHTTQTIAAAVTK